MLLGTVAQALDSQQVGVSVVLALFVVGGLILAAVSEPRGIAVAKEAGQEGLR